MYCVKCKKRTDTTNERITTTKNNRHMKRGTCVICGTTKTQFIKASEGGSLLNKAINSLRCIYPAIILRAPVLN